MNRKEDTETVIAVVVVYPKSLCITFAPFRNFNFY